MASSTSRPSTRDVVKALKTLNLEKTRNLVFHLGVPPTALDDIKDESSGDTRKQKYVEKWLDIDTNASWEKLVSGLREIDMHVLAAEVESEHKTTEAPPPASYTPFLAPLPLAQPISAPAQLEAAPLDLPVVASTPPALTPTPANSQVLAVSEARVEEVRVSIEVESTTEAPPPASYTYTIPTSVFASIAQLQQLISTLSQQEEAASLPVATSTAAALALANSHFPTVSEARVEEVRGRIENFKELFADLTVDVELDLVEKEDQERLFFKRFRSYLLALPVAKEGVHVKFFRESANDILESKEVQKLFYILNRYCNYSNYEIIVVVAKKFCAAPVRQGILTYRDTHITFEKNTTVDVYLCAISAPPESKIFVGCTKMAMKINKPSNICTLYEIRQLKESIARNASLHAYSMYIEDPEEGSVHVVLRFPEECGWSVAGAMTAEFMETHQLTDVTFDGEDLKSYLTGQSAIIDAVWTEVLHQLLDLVASADLQDKDGWSALMKAAVRGHTEVVKQLLKAGANTDLQDQDGWSALMLTASKGHTKVVKQLLEAGANTGLLSTDSEEDWSALMYAAYEGHTEVVTQLLEAGANTDLLSTKHGGSALMYAAYKGHTEVVSQLLKAGANTDLLSTEDGVSALMVAAVEGHTEVVTQLLEAGANTDLLTIESGGSPLMFAAMVGHTEVVTQLLEAGANTDLQDKDGDTAVIYTTLSHHPDSLRQLVRAGADLNLCNKEGLTALTISSRNGSRDITDILLSGGDINIDLQTSNGWSALFFSAEKGDVLTAQSLLKAGANPHLRDQNGLTALDIAASAASDPTSPDGGGDYDGVCELLHSHMLESAHLQDIPAGDQDKPTGDLDRPTGDQDRPAGDQDRPTGDQDRPAGDQDSPTGDQDTSLPAQDRPSSAATSSAPQRGQIGKAVSGLAKSSREKMNKVFGRLLERILRTEKKEQNRGPLGGRGQPGQRSQGSRVRGHRRKRVIILEAQDNDETETYWSLL